ncbi:MAG TPA: type II toxin-antitoxin system RelE/ParE family toxin [bacterium]|nr:type II toxin-antitoxin system RelE/ParE family toxin [bacterium]
MTLTYSRQAIDRIRGLPPDLKKSVRAALEGLVENAYSGKPLQRELAGFWSLRVQRYRIIYKILTEERRILVYSLGRRERVYEDLAKSL